MTAPAGRTERRAEGPSGPSVPERARAAGFDGLIRPEEGERLRELAATVPPDLPVVELGSYKGMSTVYLARGARGPVYAIDVWDPAAHAADSIFAAPDIRETFERQLREHGVRDRVTAIRGRSTEVAEGWGEPVGMLFVDARHDYRGARADFDAWAPHVVRGGVVAMHDYGNPRWRRGIARVVDETIAHWPGFEVWHWLAYARVP